MGIQSFTKFLRRQGAGRSHRIGDLMHRTFYIDGHGLMYALANGIDWRCGGELQTYRSHLKRFAIECRMRNLKVKIYVDGLKNPLKQATLDWRTSRRLALVRRTFSGFEAPKETLLPPMTLSIFFDTLLESGIPVVIVHGEADSAFCRAALLDNGIVCSDDSDCFIYPTRGVVLLRDFLKFRDNIDVYERARVARALLPGFKEDWLKLFAVLSGNDYTKHRADDVIRHISSVIQYGYFLVKVAKFVAQYGGDVNTVTKELTRVAILSEEDAKLFIRCNAIYDYDDIHAKTKCIRSMCLDYQCTMFMSPGRAMRKGRCYLPVLPYDQDAYPDVWILTRSLRRLCYRALDGQARKSITEVYCDGTEFAVDCGGAISPILTASRRERLHQLHTLLCLPAGLAKWTRRWRIRRMPALANIVCHQILSQFTESYFVEKWATFERVLARDASTRPPFMAVTSASSLTAFLYVLFQVVVQHLNLLSGIFGTYDCLPPYLALPDGSSLQTFHKGNLDSDLFAPPQQVCGRTAKYHEF